MAKVIAIGQPANDAEREVIAHLRDRLPDSFTLFHNFELRVGNQTFEIDLALLAPHAVYLVDVKSTVGEIHVHAGKWFPEGRPPFASPLAKLRQHARVTKALLVGSPERLEMKRVYVDAVVLLTAPDAFLNDPANVDSPAVVSLSRSVAFFQDPSRLPEQFQPAPELRPLQGRILQTLQGGARPPASRELYGDWQIEERLGGTAFYTEYRAYNRFAGPAAGRVSLRVYEADPYLPDRSMGRPRTTPIWLRRSSLSHMTLDQQRTCTQPGWSFTSCSPARKPLPASRMRLRSNAASPNFPLKRRPTCRPGSMGGCRACARCSRQIGQMPVRREALSVPAIAEAPEISRATKKLGESVHKLDSTVPKLSKAAFLAVKRDHTISWESVHRVSSSTAQFLLEDEPEVTVSPVRHEPPTKPSDVSNIEQNKRQAEPQVTHPTPAQVEQILPTAIG